MPSYFGSVVCLAATFAATSIPCAAQSPAAPWQPNSPAVNAADYAGSETCATCHHDHARTQAGSEMALSILRPADPHVLPGHSSLTYARGPYTYTLRKENGQLVFTATDGQSTVTEPVFAAVGSGFVFQAYIIRHDGVWHRAPIDYVAAHQALAPDPDAGAAIPASLDGALGATLSNEGIRGCFACHSPSTVIGDQLDIRSRTPGIGCETCHGPAAKHVAAVGSSEFHNVLPFNPAHQPVEQQSQFCNSCHVSAANMKKQNPAGVRSVTSEDYRLQSSRCWNPSDKRIACVTCHAPHAPMDRAAKDYDAKCLACHLTRSASVDRSRPGKACPKQDSNCASCHMPKIAVPNSVILYADHRIRIPREGAPFPE